MPETVPMTGACLCGACSFTAVPQASHGGACHCGQCRKWSGGIFLAVYCGENVTFVDGAPLGVYSSSAWGERVFCTVCGSTLVWRTKDLKMQSVSVQAFDTPEAFPITEEIFIDRKPDTYALAGDLSQMTEAEVFAKYGPGSGDGA